MNIIFKIIILVLLDFFSICISIWLAFSLRLETLFPPQNINLNIFVIYFIILGVLFYFFKIYNIIIRYFDIYSITKIFKAVLFAQFILIITNFILYENIFFPRSISFVAPLFIGILIILSRISLNFLVNSRKINSNKKNVLIYGVDSESVLFAKNLRNYSIFYNIVGFVDHGKYFNKREVNGIKVYQKSELEKVVKSNNISVLFLKKNIINKFQYEQISQSLKQFNTRIKFISNLNENFLDNFKSNIIDLRSIFNKKKIKISDQSLQKNFYNKNILITGAGGSIGSEISSQILKHNPKKVFLLDNSEVSLFNLFNKLNKKYRNRIKILLGDCSDINFLKTISKYDIDEVYHAAAYKHVNFLEQNIFSAIKNNIFATQHVLDFVAANKIKKFIFISSDKAVNPLSILGITKKFGELLTAYYYSLSSNKNIFTIVRFGNVVGSSGSAIPLFQKQILSGGPVTVRNKKSKRYFMSVEEAIELVLHASIINNSLNVFALDMGKQINIFSIVERMIRLYGFNIKNKHYPDGDIAIKITKLEKGEKLEEEISLGKNLQKTSHPQIFCCKETFKIKYIKSKIKEIKILFLNKKINKNKLFKIINH